MPIYSRGLTLAALLFCSLVSTLASGIMLGGVGHATVDDHTNEVATWAVTQLNSKANVPKSGDLAFVKVVSAKKQVVAGIKHILTLETKDGAGKAQSFEVTVWEKPAYNKPTNEEPMELTDFKVLNAPVAE